MRSAQREGTIGWSQLTLDGPMDRSRSVTRPERRSRQEHPGALATSGLSGLKSSLCELSPPLARTWNAELKTIFVAACAMVDVDGRVLIAQRPQGKQLAGLWEFPGGKVEPGETPEACLIRELDEELGVSVTEACLAPFVFASHAYATFHLLMPLYLCRRWEGFAVAREHAALAWVRPADMSAYPMPPADLPLVAWLRDLL
jgi:8-oxo-dGTP diphosphatase